MPAVSTFTWLDHRDEDQQRVRDALAAFDQPGIVDPLGFGVVRDTFSDALFPGLSTVQTRARYFLFVPWAYRRLDRERIASRDGAERARQWEVQTIAALIAGSPPEHQDGIIGRNSQAATKQLPSFIYWGGLARFDIRRFDGSRQEYVASLDARRRDPSIDEHALWPGLPEPPDDVFDATSLALEPHEAEFLRDRIVAATHGTFLERLVRDATSDQRSETPWGHPLALTAPPTIRAQLRHARLFANVVWGAELLYNRELSHLLEDDGQQPLRTDYDAHLREWLEIIGGLQPELDAWDREELWRLATGVNPRAETSRTFVDGWLQRVVEDAHAATNSNEVLRQLERREQNVKGPRAKLSNKGARERSPSAQGGSLMRFRWPQAQQIIGDITAGLGA